MHAHWTSAQIPDLAGKNAVVTGARRELGRTIIERLREHGATVFAISRDDMSRDRFGDGVEPVRMNPTSMESIQRGSERIRDQVDHVDLLVHAASISVAPRFRSREGHDLMLATNYLGFVLLTHELSPAMRKSTSPRVILAGTGGGLDVDIDLDRLDTGDDLDWDVAYAQSRLAAMMFAMELNSRAEVVQSTLLSAVADGRESHPEVDAHHPIRRHVHRVVSRLYREPRDLGALPILYASTSDAVRGGHYYETHGHGRIVEHPLPERIPDSARSSSLRQELWQRTEHMLGVRLTVA